MTLPDGTHFDKSPDPDCVGNNGWIVFGQIIPTGTGFGDDDGIPYDHQFHISYNRKDEVYYNGEGVTIVKEDGTIEVIVLLPEGLQFIFEKVVFCGCQVHEIDCGDCCFSCCKIAEYVLDVFSGETSNA